MSIRVVQFAVQAKRLLPIDESVEEKPNKKSRVELDVSGFHVEWLVDGLEGEDADMKLACANELDKRDQAIEEFGIEVNRRFPGLCVMEGCRYRDPVSIYAGEHEEPICEMLAEATGNQKEDRKIVAIMSIPLAFGVPRDPSLMYKARRIVERAESAESVEREPVIRLEPEDADSVEGAEHQQGRGDWNVARRVKIMIEREAEFLGAKFEVDALDSMVAISFPFATIGTKAYWWTVEVPYEHGATRSLLDCEGPLLERATKQMIWYAKAQTEMDSLKAEAELGVQFEVCWDGIAVTRGEEGGKWMLRFDGEVSGYKLLRYLRLKRANGEGVFALRDGEEEIIVIEDDEEAAEAPTKEEPKLPKAIVVVDLTGDDDS